MRGRITCTERGSERATHRALHSPRPHQPTLTLTLWFQEEKVYVQHSIAKQGEPLWKLLSDDHAYVYVCGSVGGRVSVLPCICVFTYVHMCVGMCIDVGVYACIVAIGPTVNFAV